MTGERFGLGSDKSHRKQHEIGFPQFFRARHFLKFRRSAGGIRCEPHFDGLELFNLAVGPDELLGQDAEYPLASLFVRGAGTQAHRPVRPRLVFRTIFRRHRQEFKIGDRCRAVAVGRSDAITAGVAAADDDDVFAGGLEPFQRIARVAAVLLGKKLHRHVNALEVASRSRQVAPFG